METALAVPVDPDDLATEQAEQQLREGINNCRKIVTDYRTTLSKRPRVKDTGKSDGR